MIDEELLNKFDRIQDLPVSEEMLGAYMENNLSAIESLQVKQHIIDNPELLTFVKEISTEELEKLKSEETLEDLQCIIDIPKLDHMVERSELVNHAIENKMTVENYGRNKKIKR